jgi:hypothetical protein
MAGGGGVPGWGTASQCARTPWQRPGDLRLAGKREKMEAMMSESLLSSGGSVGVRTF